jgi:ABC-type glycerol-3-phosphate transport system permease component
VSRRRAVTGLINWGFVVLVGALFLAPAAWMLSASFKPDARIHEDVDSLESFLPEPFTTQNYGEAVQRGDVHVTLLNSLIYIALIAVGGLLVNAPAAYAFARMRFPGREIIFNVLVLTIIIPLEVIVIPMFLTVRATVALSGAVGVHAWTLLALSVPFMAKAFNIYLLRQYFLNMPRSLEEAAFLDGLGWFGAFWRIMAPNALPAIVTVVMLDFVIHWSDFLWPLVICQEEGTRTVQLGLGNFFTQPPVSWGAIMAYAVLATLPLLAVFAVGQRWIVRSLATTGVRE